MAAADAGTGKRKILPIALVMMLIIGAWWFLMRPSGDDEPSPSTSATPSASPTAGTSEAADVAVLEPIQVNLADGHFLSVGLGLRLASVDTSVDGSAALDAAITVFGGRSMDELVEPEVREQLKAQLEEQVVGLYGGEVVGLYLTEFLIQ